MNISNLLAAGMLADLNTQLNGGTAKVYSGTQPADADTALSGNTLLATITLQNPAFNIANNVATLNGNPSTTAVATNTATFVRFETSGASTVLDAAVGSDVTMNDSNVLSGNDVAISSLSFTLPKS